MVVDDDDDDSWQTGHGGQCSGLGDVVCKTLVTFSFVLVDIGVVLVMLFKSLLVVDKVESSLTDSMQDIVDETHKNFGWDSCTAIPQMSKSKKGK